MSSEFHRGEIEASIIHTRPSGTVGLPEPMGNSVLLYSAPSKFDAKRWEP